MKHYMVTIKDTCDKHVLKSELTQSGSGVIPRSCTCVDHMPLSNRNVIFELDDAEAVVLANDVRVIDVVSMDFRALVVNQPEYEKTVTPNFTNEQNSSHDNWGLVRCTQDDNGPLGSSYRYAQQGEGVDVVIVDSGINVDHPEFRDEFGVSRIQQIEWEVGMNIAKPNFYSDQSAHGTHVAGIIVGLTQGWAPKARIYSMKIFDTDSYDTLTALQLVRAWHNAKSGPDAGRPTITNHSWSSGFDYPANYPISALQGTRHPLQDIALDAEIDNMITDGIILVCAAGNANHYIANVADTVNYDDFYYLDGSLNWVATSPEATFILYHNRLSPGGGGDPYQICTGASGTTTAPENKEEIAEYSNRGSLITAFAPGTNIQSADKDVEVLLHADGPNGSTTIVNEMMTHTATVVANAHISTTQSKFGGSSMYFDGTANTRIEIPDSPEFDFGTRDFTIDFQLYKVSQVGSHDSILNKRANNSIPGPLVVLNNTIFMSSNGTSWNIFSGAVFPLSLNTWTHITIANIGNDYVIWVNGSIVLVATNSSGLVSNNDPWRIGGEANGNFSNIYVDEFRIVNGRSIWNSSFTPMVEQYRALKKITGTSMASPQIAGMLALTVEYNPTMTQSEAIAWIQQHGQQSTVTDSVGNELQGSTTTLMYSVYNGLSVKDGGDWKTPPYPHVKDGGVWKPIDKIWIKNSGSWKIIYG